MPNEKICMTEFDFVTQLEKSFSEEGYLTKRELGLGHGIADLVITKLDLNKVNKRLNYKQYTPLDNHLYFRALKFIPDIDSAEKPIQLDSLSDISQISLDKLKYKIIKPLLELGYIKEFGQNMYMKVDGWVPLAKELVAFEAKLTNWKKGFYQANRYKLFADKVYLVVPVEYIHLPDKSLFRKFGIGLMSYDAKKGERTVVIKPTKSKPQDMSKKNIALEGFFQGYINKQSSLVPLKTSQV